MGDDAGIIVRSLLELAILAKWTEQEKADRSRRFLAWYCKQISDLAASLGETAPAEALAEWASVGHLFEYTDKTGKTRFVQNWYGNLSIRDLAASLTEDKPPPHGYRTTAELHYVGAYKTLSNIEHSNPLASQAFLQRNKGSNLIGYLSRDELIHEDVKLSFEYFCLIFNAWNSHFRVIPSEEIQELSERAKEYFQRFQDEEAERKSRLKKTNR